MPGLWKKGGPTCGNDEKVMEGRCKDKKVTAVIHPSWAAKQRLKEKSSTKIDLKSASSSQAKKIKFDD